MTLLSKSLLNDPGIVLTEQDFELLEEHFDTTLRYRDFEEIVEVLTPGQAHELIALQDVGEGQLLEWLLVNALNIKVNVSDEGGYSTLRSCRKW